MAQVNNKVDSKLKFFVDNTPNLNPIVPTNKIYNSIPSEQGRYSTFPMLSELNKQNNDKSIDRGDVYTKKEFNQNMSSALLNRQFAPAIFNAYTDLESDLIKPTDCTASQRINYNIDNVSGVSLENYSRYDVVENPSTLKTAYDLLISEEEHNSLSNKFKQSCGQKKKTLDWSDYQSPPRKSEGHGFGNPNNYQETYIGQDTRAYVDQNAREKDLTNRTMTPPDVLKINYSNLPYEWETREGVSTRTYKKMITNFQ